MPQVQNIHGSSRGGHFSAGTAYCTWHLRGEGAAELMETLSLSAMVVATSGLSRELRWESMRLSAR